MMQKYHTFQVLIIPLHLSLACSNHLPTHSPPSPTTVLVRRSFSQAATTARPGCRTTCGDLIVPYPFGIGVHSGCSLSPGFDIICNQSSTSSPRAFTANGNYEIVDISDDLLHIKNHVATQCYTRSGDSHDTGPTDVISINLSDTPYSLSDTNRFDYARIATCLFAFVTI